MKNRHKRDTRHNPAHRAGGFTIIELMVTVFVAALFLTGFITLTTTYNYFMALAQQNSIADNLAYSYVQKYARPDYSSSQWFTCGSGNDRSTNPSAVGSRIAGGDLNGDDVNLPNPVSYTVTALAPYGCSGINTVNPIRLDAQVTYGAANRTIHHVVYVNGAI